MAGRPRVSDRLMSREQGLARRQMPNGGEAFAGPLANQALQTLGARAMTMDNSIFVQDSFNAANPSDLALYAHEAHHQAESGGSDAHGPMDAEEQAARARERLVLHQSGAGMDPNAILQGLGGHDPQSPAQADAIFAAHNGDAPTDASGDPEPMEAYRKMARDGMGHAEIVRTMVDRVLQTLDRQESEQGVRSGSGR